MSLLSLIRRIRSGNADFYVGGKENPYLLRWYLIPQNRFFNIYLHKFLRDDDDRALHDHPWASMSICIKGGYIEYVTNNKLPGDINLLYFSRKFIPVFRKATHMHRIELYKNTRHSWGAIPAWTIFITGPKVREWGFLCPKGWTHWRDFCDVTDHGNIGRGCE